MTRNKDEIVDVLLFVFALWMSASFAFNLFTAISPKDSCYYFSSSCSFEQQIYRSNIEKLPYKNFHIEYWSNDGKSITIGALIQWLLFVPFATAIVVLYSIGLFVCDILKLLLNIKILG